MILENLNVSSLAPISTTIIDITSAFGTVFAIIIAIFTLYELKKQRESSYLPQIAFVPSPFYIYSDFLNNISYWADKEGSEQEKEEFYKNHPFTNFQLNAFNVGTGVAKNVTFEWHYQLEAMVTSIKKYKNFEELFEIISGSSKWVFFKHGAAVNISEKDDSGLPFIIPMMYHNSPIKIALPAGFMLLYPILCAAVMAQIEEKSELLDEIATISRIDLVVEYTDINDKKYNNIIIINPDFYHLKVNPDYFGIEIKGEMKPSDGG